jgi:hypothetical protein
VDLLNNHLESEQWGNWHARRYVETVNAFIDEHGWRGREGFERLSDAPPGADNVFRDWFTEFSNAVSYAQTRIRLRRKGGGPLSVVLNSDHRREIGSLLAKIRAIVPRLDVSEGKRDAIYGHIARLQAEVDKSRTRLEAFFALTLDTADTLGKASEKGRPFVDMLERLKKIFFEAKSQDLPPQLPPPADRKRIEPPARNQSQMDDEIPF